jgi:hypothetical protein
MEIQVGYKTSEHEWKRCVMRTERRDPAKIMEEVMKWLKARIKPMIRKLTWISDNK